MEEHKQNQLPVRSSDAGVNIAIGVMCLVVGLSGLDNLTSNPTGSIFRPILGILMLVSGLIGFAINLVVFLRLRKK